MKRRFRADPIFQTKHKEVIKSGGKVIGEIYRYYEPKSDKTANRRRRKK